MTNIDKEREAFEDEFPVPHGVIWWGDIYRRDDGRSTDYQQKFNVWMRRAKQHSGEAVAKVVRNSSGQIHITDAKGNYFDVSKYIGAELFLSPQQPQGQDKLAEKAVADALEMAAQLIEQNISWSDAGDDEQTLINNVLHDAGKAIRNLINQPTQG